MFPQIEASTLGIWERDLVSKICSDGGKPWLCVVRASHLPLLSWHKLIPRQAQGTDFCSQISLSL